MIPNNEDFLRMMMLMQSGVTIDQLNQAVKDRQEESQKEVDKTADKLAALVKERLLLGENHIQALEKEILAVDLLNPASQQAEFLVTTLLGMQASQQDLSGKLSQVNGELIEEKKKNKEIQQNLILLQEELKREKKKPSQHSEFFEKANQRNTTFKGNV